MLVFPEGRKGTEKLYKDRYQLRRFGRGGFVEAAMRAQVPIVPVAVVGAEESMPVFAQLGALQRLTGLLYFPITPTFPHFGLLGFARLPAGQVQHPLPRADPDRPVGRRAVATTAAWSRGRRRRSAPASRTSSTTCSPSAARSGSDEPPRPRSPASRASGAAGSPRRSSATPTSRRSSASRPTTRRSSSSAPSTCASAPSTRCCAGSSSAARDRHGGRHAADRRLRHRVRRASRTRRT